MRTPAVLECEQKLDALGTFSPLLATHVDIDRAVWLTRELASNAVIHAHGE